MTTRKSLLQVGWIPSSAHLASLARCFRSSATKAADPSVPLALGKLLETSGDVTVKSKAALRLA